MQCPLKPLIDEHTTGEHIVGRNLVTICNQLKLLSADGTFYATDWELILIMVGEKATTDTQKRERFSRT